MATKKCVICGSNISDNYIFCTKCNNLKEEGKIIKCPDCGKWHLITALCNCQKYNYNKPHNECIICGNPSNGHLFCISCYNKYKQKVILVQFSNFCKDLKIIDCRYDSPFTSEDGHKVKSKSEILIDNYLFNHNIRHIYEKPLMYKDDNTIKSILPDFYLPDFNIYIEHWGKDNADEIYSNTKTYKEKIYEKEEIKYISTSEDDRCDIYTALEKKLKEAGINIT